MSDLAGGAVQRRALFSDMPPGLASSWAGRHARVPNVFFEQLLDMGFPDWLCVISLERTEAVGAAPALDFCLGHMNDDFATDPHAPAPAAPAPPSPTPSLAPRPALSVSSPADVSISLSPASSTVERSAMMQAADTIVAAAAHTALAPLRALSASLKSSSSSSPRSPAHASATRPNSVMQADETVECDAIGARRTRSAPTGAAATAAADTPPVTGALRTKSAAVPQFQRSASTPETVANPGRLQRVMSAGRAVTAAAHSLAGAFKQQQPFPCLICGDDFPVELRCDLPCASPSCASMMVCKNCVQRNIEVNVNDGDLQRLCPVCNGDFSEDFIRQNSTAETFEKYTRFKISKNNPNMRSCSKCNALMEGSSAAPSMRCGGCSHTFCFTHGDSHPGKSCAQWARDNLESEKETEKVIKSLTKPCPGCQVATQKSAGCNHMKCTRCKTEWCWLCGSAIVVGGTYPSHYADWNVFGCRGAQFTDSQRANTVYTKLVSVLLAPFLLVPAVAFLLIWLPFFPLWIVMYCASRPESFPAFFKLTLKVEGWILMFPLISAVVAFYAALLLPGVPFCLLFWKIRDDDGDWDDFEELMRRWFMLECFLLFLAPALAIAAVSAAVAIAVFCAWTPFGLVAKAFGSRKFWKISKRIIKFSFLGTAAAPAAAVMLALFPFSIPVYFILVLYNDDD